MRILRWTRPADARTVREIKGQIGLSRGFGRVTDIKLARGMHELWS